MSAKRDQMELPVGIQNRARTELLRFWREKEPGHQVPGSERERLLIYANGFVSALGP
jgi:hypothetical protein